MRIALLQTDIAWQAPETNHRRLVPWIDRAAAAGARLAVLPEVFAHGFSTKGPAPAEPFDGPTVRFLEDHARRTGMWICGSVPLRPAEGAKPFNTLVFAGPDGTRVDYRKIHPFTFAGEHERYEAGDTFAHLVVDGVRITPFVCYDLRFADAFWVNAERTDLYVVVANWPERRRHHWTCLLAARAIENQAYMAGVNRVGEGGGLSYVGDSRVVDPWGRVLAAAAEQETMLLAEVDPAVVAHARRTFPVLADRRPLPATDLGPT